MSEQQTPPPEIYEGKGNVVISVPRELANELEKIGVFACCKRSQVIRLLIQSLEDDNWRALLKKGLDGHK